MLRVLGDTFWPGGPGYAITLLVLIVAIGSLAAFPLIRQGEWHKARRVKRLAIATALAVSVIYLTGWIYFTLACAAGAFFGAVWIKV